MLRIWRACPRFNLSLGKWSNASHAETRHERTYLVPTEQALQSVTTYASTFQHLYDQLVASYVYTTAILQETARLCKGWHPRNGRPRALKGFSAHLMTVWGTTVPTVVESRYWT